MIFVNSRCRLIVISLLLIFVAFNNLKLLVVRNIRKVSHSHMLMAFVTFRGVMTGCL
jgi:hypothetical protein